MPKQYVVRFPILALLILSIGLVWMIRRPGKGAGLVAPGSGSLLGSIEGEVVDGKTGQRCQAKMTVSTHDYAHVAQPDMTTGWSRDTGLFLFDKLTPGDYDVSARTGGGQTGVLEGISVGAGSETASLKVKVAPGGRIHVRFENEATHGFLTVIREGVVVACELIQPPAFLDEVVPAGPATVRFNGSGDNRPQEKRIDIAVGDVKEIVFEDGG